MSLWTIPHQRLRDCQHLTSCCAIQQPAPSKPDCLWPHIIGTIPYKTVELGNDSVDNPSRSQETSILSAPHICCAIQPAPSKPDCLWAHIIGTIPLKQNWGNGSWTIPHQINIAFPLSAPASTVLTRTSSLWLPWNTHFWWKHWEAPNIVAQKIWTSLLSLHRECYKNCINLKPN